MKLGWLTASLFLHPVQYQRKCKLLSLIQATSVILCPDPQLNSPYLRVKNVFLCLLPQKSYLPVRRSEVWCYRNLLWAPRSSLHKHPSRALPVLFKQTRMSVFGLHSLPQVVFLTVCSSSSLSTFHRYHSCMPSSRIYWAPQAREHLFDWQIWVDYWTCSIQFSPLFYWEQLYSWEQVFYWSHAASM